jgi:hypothetical protein
MLIFINNIDRYFTALQCCGSGMFIPVLIFLSRSIFNPEVPDTVVTLGKVIWDAHPGYGSGFFPHP